MRRIEVEGERLLASAQFLGPGGGVLRSAVRSGSGASEVVWLSPFFLALFQFRVRDGLVDRLSLPLSGLVVRQPATTR